MADETQVLLSISDMIDLAIGTPEVGVVDFNMLQTVLHCLAQQLRVLGKNVELRGSVAALPLGRENVQTIAVSEYVIQTDDKSGPTSVSQGASDVGGDQTMLVVERIKKADSPITATPKRVGSPVMPGTKVEVTPPTGKLNLVTLSKFNVLEDTVADLKDRVYGSIPNNQEILDNVRSQSNIKAITDMWTSLNVSSRLEAAENGISKLSSLVQDLIGGSSDLQDAVKRRSSKISTVSAGTTKSGKSTHDQPDQTQKLSTPWGATSRVLASMDLTDVPPEMAALVTDVLQLREDLDALAKSFCAAIEDVSPDFELPPELKGLMSMTGEAGGKRGGKGAAGAGGGRGAAGADGAAGAEGAASAEVAGSATVLMSTAAQQGRAAMAAVTTLSDKLKELEKKLKDCCENATRNEVIFKDQLTWTQDQLEYLTKQVTALGSELSSGKLNPDVLKDLHGLMHLFGTVQEMQGQLQQVHETALQLAAEKEDRAHHINALLEQIELLKNIKLDREDMVEAMAEKADLRLLARKVSHDQFELACDDLSKGLEHALGKLNIQEALWQQALDDIQREIETKLDKIELSPVKEFFNNKLKQLQENLKQMASLRREAEAAGTKRKLLRDVNCISCDANAVMQMEAAPSMPSNKPLPPNLSMKPYLSYELDAIRKSQAAGLPQRNMHDWEAIDKQMLQPKPPQKVRSETDKHLCNRYCGGSHTITTPAQRVARLGHFIKQWGPDVLPLSSGLAAGDDGKMYKVTATEAANVGTNGADATCTPRAMPKKSEPVKPPQKPLVISAECRCLEEGGDRAAK